MTTGRGAEATDAFLRAIDLEIEAIPMGSATDVIPLRQGTRTGKDGDDFEYVFQARSKPDVARRSLIRSSTTRGRWERATAAVLPDGKVRVTTPADLGRESANAQLREDATVPPEQLAERISAAGRPGGVNLATAGFVLGDGAPRMARWPDVERLVDGVPRPRAQRPPAGRHRTSPGLRHHVHLGSTRHGQDGGGRPDASL